MHFTIAVIVCLGYFLSPVWSNGLNEDQLNVLICLYADIKVPNDKIAEHQITKVLKDSFGIEQPTQFFEYDPSKDDFVNLHFLLKALGEKDKISDGIKVKKLMHFEIEYYINEFIVYAESHDKREYLTLNELLKLFMNNWKQKDVLNTISEEVFGEKVKKLTRSEVYYYLCQFIAQPEMEKQRGYLTLQQLSTVFKNLKLYKSSEAKLEEQKSKIGDDIAINAAELLLIVLEITPEGDGLSLSQIDKFVHLYEVHETVSGNINSSACQEVFDDLDITSRQDDLNLLLHSNQPFAKVLIDLIIIAAECSQAVKENESRLLGPGMVVLCIDDFNRLDKNQDGLLSDGEYNPFVDQLKINQGPVKDSLTFEKVQDILKKFDDSDGNEVKKVLNIAEYMEIVLFYKSNFDKIEEPTDVISKTDRAE